MNRSLMPHGLTLSLKRQGSRSGHRLLQLIAVLYFISSGPCLGQLKAPGTSTHLPKEQSFSLVILPDIQYYTASFPGILEQQMEWIVKNQKAYNIRYVMSMGDITDANHEDEWEKASAACKILEKAKVPYSIVQGNHDLKNPNIGNGEAEDGERHNIFFNKYFPTTRFEINNSSWWKGGFFQSGHVENYYCTFEYLKTKYLILNLEYAPRSAMLNWANDIAESDTSRKIIVVTHGYITNNGNKEISLYGLTGNTSPVIWNEFIKKHSNVLMVLCGHYNGVFQGTDYGRNGRRVFNVLTDYQMEKLNGSDETIARNGNGWLRIMTFYPKKDSVVIRIKPVCTFFGGIGEQMKGYDWSEGWTNAKFFHVGASEYLFLLKSQSGNVHIQKINTDGTVGDRADTRTWTSGWTSAEFYTAGNSTYLFLLKMLDGKVHIHKMNGDGTVGTMKKEYDWSPGWSVVRPFKAGANQYLFLLKSTDGTVHIHKINSDGTIGKRVDTRDWTEAWSAAEFYTSGNTTYLILLKESDGLVHIHKMNNNGTVGALTDQRNWTSGYSMVSTFNVMSRNFLLIGKTHGLANDGRNVHIHFLNDDGKIGTMLVGYKWTEGWTIMQPYSGEQGPRLFMMKEDGDASDGKNVHIHSILTNGYDRFFENAGDYGSDDPNKPRHNDVLISK